MADWIVRLIGDSGYAGVALLMLLETVFPPIPSEVIMSVAGLESSHGTMALPLVIAAGTLGAMVGNTMWYYVARWIGMERIRPVVERHGRWLTISWRSVQHADRWFDRYGPAFVCLGRMVPSGRSLVSVPAGLLGMPLLPFLLWSTAGTAGWTAMLAWLGYTLGQNFDRVEAWLGPISTAVLVAMVAWYLWRVWRWKPH